MNEKKQKRTVLLGVLLLTGLFAIGYIGINRIAFAGSGAATVLRPMDNYSNEQIESQSSSEAVMFSSIHYEYQFITETADLNNGREAGYFNVDRLVPLQDHYLTRYEAEVIVAEVLSQKLGVEFDTSEFRFGLLDQTPGSTMSMWLTSTPDYDNNGQVHDISIDAITGDLLEFNSVNVTVEYFLNIEHNGISFVVEEWGNPVQESKNTRHFQPYMLTQVEAATLAADYIYEEYDVTMEGLRIQLPFSTNDDRESFWTAWIMPAEDEYFGNGSYGTPASMFFIQINATTGELIGMDLRDFDSEVETNNNGDVMRVVKLD